MAMSDARSRARNDRSRSGSPVSDRLPPGRTPATVLVSATRNRKHPPLVQHVNDCPECMIWLMDYMTNVAKTMERKFR